MTALNAEFYTNCWILVIIYAACQEPLVALGAFCMLKLSMFLINDNKRRAATSTLERDKGTYALELRGNTCSEHPARKDNGGVCSLYACDVIWECRMGQQACGGVCCNPLRFAERRSGATQETICKVLDALYELIMS